ncbi:aspartate aminotransferase family protein [Haloarcula mannanilytica]|uniref:Aspartate aminotransferase family protein n=1 Tax=Haloarcula mannanilytica TaxID=2509225 RepID=A0A4C2EQZ0_9EURY|nr:aspartate aminotransferase family protein [Haloarcula mannanilytica]GCF15890.1 aspartate aminotransferase family protein [Haloarcula mannanilytica]
MSDTEFPPSGSAVPESMFLGNDSDTLETFEAAVETACCAIRESYLPAATPYTGASISEVRSELADIDCLPETGTGLESAIERVGEQLLSNAVGFHDPQYVAHLQCPPSIPGIAAELLLAASNQSLDTWGESPSGTVLEQRFVNQLAKVYGFPDTADGVFTSGGTQSNFAALLLARNRHLDVNHGVDAQSAGVPEAAGDLRILCSEAAHFSVAQAASHLGLGENAVVGVPTDNRHRMDLDALDETLAKIESSGGELAALVATAGTTDFGSIDPLDGLADRADRYDMWYHVDAASGGALAFSDRHADRLAGIKRADSLTVDFHKLFYQPVSCGAILVRDETNYEYTGRNASYLNPADTDAPTPVSKSVQTTRRFDVLKPFLTFQAVGTSGVAACVERTANLASVAAQQIRSRSAFKLVTEPELTTVLFRYRPSVFPSNVEEKRWHSELTNEIRDRARKAGDAIVARTIVEGTPCLKFTFMNPKTTQDDIALILDTLAKHGERAENTSVAGSA